MILNTTKSSCLPLMKPTSNGAFQGDNPLDFALPLAVLQICLVLVLSRCLSFFLRPMRQPRVIAETIGGILLGPSALGRNKAYLHAVFPTQSLTVLDTLANIGLLLFLFLVGIELDPKSLRQTGKKSLAIAAAGISVPFALAIGNSYVLRQTISKGGAFPPFLVFMGVAFSVTAFPVLARILAELKLLTTNVGRMAMSAAAVNDVFAWILLALAIILTGPGHSPLVSVWVLLSGCFFIVVVIFLIRPIFLWMAKHCHEGEPVDETYIRSTLVIVLAAGFLTDAIGIHALFGAFVVGIFVPKEGPFASALVEKVEDIVSGLLLPLYFASSGLKTNIATIQGLRSWGLLVMVVATACFGKIFGTFIVSLAFKLPCREALALGFLMNSKGLVELIVLNIGKDKKVLDEQTFSIMVLMALFTTFITTPLVVAIYKPARRAGTTDYKYRTIERENKSSQLRILVCFHGTRNIPTIVNLIEGSRGIAKPKGLHVYALHLMELSERTSAILMVHKVRKNGQPFSSKRQCSNKDHIVVAFEAFRELSKVSVKPMTSISALADMHEDICRSAERKEVAMVILPFHKHQSLDGSMQVTKTGYQYVNQRVLDHAPCSVSILVDRGLCGTSHVSASQLSSSIAVLFFGGPDDLEALAYGLRMAEHPGVNLMVVYFAAQTTLVQEVTTDQINELLDGDDDNNNAETGIHDFVVELRKKIPTNASVRCVEKLVQSATQVFSAIQEFSRCNLILVGRNPEGEVVTTFLNGGSSSTPEYPELGHVGSLLASTSFCSRASILVVQRYSDKRRIRTT
ncbi:hypothetical protein Syun_026366 [Stephania yunnanensis]|uniref:Cation/H+ exchanger domain-containing protein n=1 Tax=Stephania yunnanensis TaxID=152371 RepID=A0AAP0ETC5_9MAGN